MSRLIHFHAFTPATNQRPPYLNPYYLPPAVIVSPIRWALDEQICIASITEPALLEDPECKTYVLISLKSTLLCSLHATLGSGHPGSQRTLSLIQARYWWPSFAWVVSQYVHGCSVCAISKTPHHLPARKLVPFHVVHVPTSESTSLQISPTQRGLPAFLLQLIDFSKPASELPYRGLSTALETAGALFYHLFHTFGIPEDVISDRGPQFISRVWKTFFKLLDVKVSQSKSLSGYHPQTNCQTEWKIQEIGRYLRFYCQDNQHSGTTSSRGLSMHKIPSS